MKRLKNWFDISNAKEPINTQKVDEIIRTRMKELNPSETLDNIKQALRRRCGKENSKVSRKENELLQEKQKEQKQENRFTQTTKNREEKQEEPNEKRKKNVEKISTTSIKE